MIAYDLNIGVDDTFALLRELGRDCAGALVLLPEGEEPPSPPLAPPPLTEEQVYQRLRRLRSTPLGIDGQVRVSLAGVQEKLLLTKLPSGQWALPVGGTPSTHILKPTPPTLPAAVENEALCLRVASHLGIPTARAQIMETPDRQVLVVERFDRLRHADGAVQRIHQEDTCQALSRPSTRKYEEQGGPSLLEVAKLLRATTTGIGQLEALLDLTVANVLLGNADAHAKNISLLHSPDRTVRLAPAYDLMSTLYYAHVDTTLAMFINDRRNLLELTAQDLIAEAVAWGLPRAAIERRVAALIRQAPEAISAAAADIPNAPAELVELVRNRAQMLATTLSARAVG